ncbi:MAG: MoaD/ThiS family protein [Armatimonadetes bacterium]|nr:MoaD/ThiS family protein [Akkermansiaceae bacterium]
MKITLLAFAQSRDAFGFSERVVEFEEGETARGLVGRIAPGVEIGNLRVAVDCEFASWDAALGNARELAFLPPVSGG